MDIKQKTIGELVDSLITTGIRCWMAQENMMNENLSEKERLDAGVLAQRTNVKRNLLIRAINELLDSDGFSPEEKSYK